MALIALLLLSALLLAMSGHATLPGLSRQLLADPRAQSEHPAALPYGPANLSVGGPIARTGPGFWGIVPQTTTANGLANNPAIGQFLNASPFQTFRYADLSDNCNISANIAYGSVGGVTGPCAISIPALKAWCSSRSTPCTTLLDLPAENNNSGEDAYIANWIVHTEGFQPTYWSVGNEPEMWSHFGIPWTRWSASDHSTPSPLAYALDVRAVIAAVKPVDPAAKFIGIEADCECVASWFQQTVSVNGPNLSAIAYHTYPSTTLQTSESLPQFYDPLASSANITTSYAKVRDDIRGWCADCNSLPILVTEYNAGPGWAPSNFAGTYANAVFLAASTVQGLLANLTTLMVFNLQTVSTSTYGYSMLNGANTVGPTGLVYSDLLRYLPTGTVYPTQLPGAPGNSWSVATSNATDEGLLAVNANVSATLNISTASALPTGNATLVTWQPGEAVPTSSSVSVPAQLSVPPQGIALLVDPLPRPAVGLNVSVTATPAAGVAPLGVHLAGTPVGGSPPYSANWTFGDGGTGSGLSTNHTYSGPGNYTATVTVTDAAGRTVSGSVEVRVFAPPVGWFVSAWANVSAGTAPLGARFSATIHGGTPPFSYAWSFGNGGSALGANASTVYTAPGNFTATVSVVDGRGNVTNASVPIYVAPTSPAISAWALASSSAGAAPLSVSFAAAANGSVGANYTWSFGDSSGLLYGASVDHTYPAAGRYSTLLTIRTPTNATVLLWMPIRVFDPLAVVLAAPSDSVALGSSITLTATPHGGAGPAAYYWWVNGAPAPGGGAQFTYTPSSVGSVNLSVTAIDPAGERANASLHLVVTFNPGSGADVFGATAASGFTAVGTAAVGAGALIAGGLVVAIRRGGVQNLLRATRLGAVQARLLRAIDRLRHR